MSIRNAPNMRARLRWLATSALVGAGSLVGALTPAAAQTYSDFGTVDTTAISGEGGAASPTFALSNMDARLDVSLAANATIINWQDFKVTSGKVANFTNVVAATPPVSVLNRVTSNITTIDGMLTADPSVSVFVFNPNGVVLSSTGSFSGGSLVLSTAGIGDADFLDGSGYTLTGASAAGAIQNLGTITAPGGFAAIAQNVQNSGTITAANGEVALIAAKTVSLGFAAGSPITIDVGAGTEIGTAKVDANGTISAQSIKVAGVATSGMVGTLLGVDSGASLTATANGGRVFIGNQTDMNGVAGSFVNSAAITLNTGVSVAGAVNASGQNASIGMRNLGSISVAGSLSANNATLNNGGFIDLLGIGSSNTLTTTGAISATGSVGMNGIAIEANGDVSVAQLTATNGDANVTSNTASATLGTATTGGLLDVAGSTAVTVSGNVTAGLDYIVRGKSVTLGTSGTGVAQTASGKVDVTTSDGAIIGNSGLILTSNSGGAADAGNVNFLTLDATNGGIAFAPATTIIAGTAAGRESLLGIRTAGTTKTVALGAVSARSIVDADGSFAARTFTASLTAPTSFLAGTIDASDPLDIQITGPITVGRIDVALGSLTLAANGAGNAITLNGNVSTDTGQSYLTAVTLGANSVMSSASAGDIAFSSTVDGARSLFVNTTGVTRFGGAVGGTTALASIITNSGGSTAINGGSVRTNASQVYNDAVTLGADTTLTSLGTSAITLASTVNGARALTINTSGATTFGGAVGGSTALTSLTTNATGTTAINGGAISTTGGQSYGDAVTLGANTTLSSSGSGAIAFASALNGARTLAINTGGTTSFGATVGGVNALVSITTDAAGTTAFNGGGVNTSGAQTYNDAASLGAATTLTSSTGGNITLASAVDGARTLAINTLGTTTLGAVGGTTALTSLTTNTGGTTVLNGGVVNTTGAQSYGDAVTLGASTVLTSTGNGAINFSATVNSTNETQSLRVTTGGTTTFGGLVGFITSRALESLVVDGGGSLLVNGGGVTTVNAQTYSDNVFLNSNALFGAQGNISFLGTLDGPLRTVIASNGMVTLGGAVGGTIALSQIGVTGNGGGIAINGGTVRTTGDQLYNNAVTLGANTLATSTAAGNINFVGTVNGAASLGVNTSGVTTFGGAVGGTTALTSLATNAGGSTAINGGRVTTSGAQTYGDPVSLGANTILSGSTAIFNGLLTGNGFDLTGNFTGLIDINAAFSGLDDLTLSGGGIDFTGQTLTAAGAVSLDANSGALTGGSAAAGTTLLASGASVDVVGLSGQSVSATATSGNLKLINASATTGSVDLNAVNGTATLVGNIDAGLDLRATAQTIVLGGTGAATQSAKRDVVLTATNGGVSTAAGAGTYTLTSNSDLNDYAGPAQGGETRITATGGNIDLGAGSILKSASAGGLSAGITLNAGTGTVRFAAVTGDVGSPPRADALSVTGSSITAGGDITVFRDLTLASTGAITLNNATVTRAGANIAITSDTTLTAGTLSAAGGVSAVAGSFGITAANANGGDVNLTATTGAGTLGSATASGNVLIDVQTALARVTGGVDAGGSYNVSGVGVTLGGTAFAEQKAKGNILIRSNGGVATTGSGVFFLTSNSDQSGGGATTIRTDGGDAIFGANTNLASIGGAAADSGISFDVGTGNLTFGPLTADALTSNATAATITSFGNGTVRNAVSLISTGAIDLSSVETTGPAATLTVDGATVKAARLAGAGGVIVSGDSLDLNAVSSSQNYATLTADVGDLKVATINTGTGVTLTKTGATGQLIVTGGINSGQVGVGDISINSSTAARLGAGSFASAITATRGSVSITATGDITGTETAPGSGVFNRAVVSALAADGDVTIDSPGQGRALLGPLSAGRNLTVTAGPVDIAPGAAATNGALSLTAFNGDITVGTASGGASALVRSANGNATVTGSISSANGNVSVIADAGTVTSAGGSAKGDLVLRGDRVMLSGNQGADGKVEIQGSAGGISGTAGLTIFSNRDGVGADAIILDAGGGDISLAGSTLIGGTPADHAPVGLFLRTPQNVVLGNVDALTIASVAVDHATFFPGVLGSNNVVDVTLGNVTSQNTLDITADGGITAARVQVTGANQNLALNARGVGKNLTLTDAASATGSVTLSGQTNFTGTTVTGNSVSINTNDGGITLTSVTANGGRASLRAGFGPVRVDSVTATGGSTSIDAFSDVSGRTPGTRSTLTATGATSDIVVAANGQVLLNAPMAERDLRVRAGTIDITPTAVAANGALSLIATGDIVVQSASGGASALVQSLSGNATVTTGISSANGSASLLAALTANSAMGSARTDLVVRGGNVILAGSQGADGRVDISSTSGTITGAPGLTIASNRDGTGAEALILDATGGDILLGNATITGGTAADRSLVGLRLGTPQTVTLGDINALSIVSVFADHATFAPAVLGSNNVAGLTLANVTTQNTLDMTADGNISANTVTVTGAGQNLALNARGPGSNLTLSGAVSAPGSVSLTAQNQVSGTTATGSSVSAMTTNGPVLLDTVTATSGAAQLASVQGDVRVTGVTATGGGIGVTAGGNLSARTPGVRTNLTANGAASDISFNVGGQALINAATAGRDVTGTVGNLDALTVTATAGKIDLTAATGALLLDKGSAGTTARLIKNGTSGDLRITDNLVAGTAAGSTGDVTLSSATDILVKDYSDATPTTGFVRSLTGSISATAAGNVKGIGASTVPTDRGFDTIAAGGNLNISGSGDIRVDTLNAAGALSVSTTNGSLTANGAGTTGTAVQGSALFAQAAGKTVTVTAGAAPGNLIQYNQIRAGGNVTLSADTIAVGTVETAAGTLALNTAPGTPSTASKYYVGLLTSPGNLSLSLAGAAATENLISGTNVLVPSFGATDLIAGTSITVDVAQAAQIDQVAAPAITIRGGGVTIADADAVSSLDVLARSGGLYLADGTVTAGTARLEKQGGSAGTPFDELRVTTKLTTSGNSTTISSTHARVAEIESTAGGVSVQTGADLTDLAATPAAIDDVLRVKSLSTTGMLTALADTGDIRIRTISGNAGVSATATSGSVTGLSTTDKAAGAGVKLTALTGAVSVNSGGRAAIGTAAGNSIAVRAGRASLDSATATGLLSVTGAQAASVETGVAGSASIRTTAGTSAAVPLTSPNFIFDTNAGQATLTSSAGSIAVGAGKVAQIGSAAARNAINVTAAGAAVQTATATTGAINLTANGGGLYLDTGDAGTSASLVKTGAPAANANDEIRITTKLTTRAGNAVVNSATGARINAIEAIGGNIMITTGTSATGLIAPAAISDTLRVSSLTDAASTDIAAASGDIRIGTITTNGAGGLLSLQATAGSVTGPATADLAAGSGSTLTATGGAVQVLAGGRVAFGTVNAGSVTIDADRASLQTVTTTGGLTVRAANALSVDSANVSGATLRTSAGTSAAVPLTSPNFIFDTNAGQATLTASAGSIAVTAGKVAQIGTATARDAINVTAAAAAVQTANAMTGGLTITANTGGLYVETGTSGGNATLIKRAGSLVAADDEIRVTQSLTAGGAASVDSSTHARLAQVTANGGTLSVKTLGATTGLIGGSPAGVPDAAFGRALLTTGGSNNDITVDAGSLMQIGNGTATGSIALRTGTGDIYADTLSANEDIAAKSGRDTTLIAATAGDDVELQTGRDLFATSLISRGTGPGARRANLGGASITFGAVAADRSNILIDATRDATVTSANANATFAADATGNFTASNGAATAIVASEDAAIRAGGTLTLSGPSGIAAVTAKDDVDLIATGNVSLSRVASLGGGTDDRRVAFGSALPGFGAETIARSNVFIDGGANVDVGSADAVASFAAQADGNFTAGTIVAGEDAAFGSIGNTSITSVTARDDIEAVADGTVTIRNAVSPGGLGSGNDDRRISFAAAGPGFVAESLLRNNLFVDAIGNVTLGTGATAAAPEIDIKASIGVLTSGSLTASNLKAGEDIVIASGDATIGKAEAGDDLVVNSTGGIAFLLSGQTFGTGLDDRTIAATRSGAGLTASGGLAFAAESNTAGDIVLDASGVGKSITAPTLTARNDLIVRNLGGGATALIDIGSGIAQTGLIAMTGTGAGIRMNTGLAETTASLTTTGATADIEVTTSLESKGNATISSSRDARLALVKSTAGNISATVARDLTGLAAPSAFGAGTGLRVKSLTDGGTTSITADTGDIRIGDITNGGGAVGVTATQGSVTGLAVADVLAGPGANLSAAGSISATVGNRAAIKTATAGAAIGVTATTISAETATATGSLTLTANGDALSLDTGSANGVTLLTKAGTAAAIGLTDANAARDTFTDVFGSANLAANGAGRSVTVTAAQAAQLGTVSAANSIGVTAAAAAIKTATATAGSLGITAQKGGLYLGTGTAGATASLVKTDVDGDGLTAAQLGRDELRVVTGLTSGQASTINSATDARLKSVTATTGNVGITTTRDANGLQLSAAVAPAQSALSALTDILSPDFGGAVIAASNAAGNVSVTAGRVAQIDTVTAGTNVTVTAAAAAIKAATATGGALAANATAGGLYLGTGTAGTTATLTKTDSDGDGFTAGQAGLDEVRVRTSLTSVGNTAISSATSNRLAGGSATNFVKSNAGSISVTSAGATTGLLGANAGASDPAYGRGDLLAAASAQDVTVTSGGLSQLGTVTAGRNVTVAAGNATLRGGLPVNGAIDISSVTAGSGALSLTTRAVSPISGSAEDGDIIIGTGMAGTTATINNAASGTVGNVVVTQSLRAGGNIDITTVQNARLAGDAADRAITSTGGTIRVTAAQSVTGVAGGASGGTDTGFGRANLSAAAAGQDLIIASGALVQAGSVSAGRNISVDAGNATQGNGAIDISSASAGTGALLLRARATSTANAPILDGDILLGTGSAGTTATLTNVANGGNTGNVTVTTSLSAPGTVLVDAANQAALGAVTSTGANVLVQSNQIAINGTVRAAASGEIRLVNRVDTGTTQVNGTSLGSEGAEATQFVLSDAEIDRLQAAKVIIETKQTATQTQNVTINGVSLNAGTGSTDFKVLAEKPGDQVADAGPSIFLNGLLSSETNVVRTVQIGGGDATGVGVSTTPIANRIIATTTNGGGGRINLPTATVDLRASRIVFGTKSLSDATIALSPGSVANDFVANANSLLFDSRGGYDATDAGQTFLTASSLTVRYNQFALFQNAASRGLNAGILLGDPTLVTDAPVRLRLFSTGDAPASNAFAFFGTINGFIGRSAGLLPGAVVSFAESNGTAIRINQSQSRLNGCVVGAPDKGCLTTEAPVPQLKLFDERQLLLLSAAVETPLSFDPLIGANNESLFVDFGGFAVAPDEGQCQPGDNGACPKPEGNQ